MRILFLFVFVFSTAYAHSSVKWKTSAQVETDWSGDGKPDIFKAEALTKLEPQTEFSRIVIQSADDIDFTLDGFVGAKAPFVIDNVSRKKSDVISLVKFSPKQKMPLLVLFERGFDVPGALKIYGYKNPREVDLVFSEGLTLKALQDLDGDGTMELVGVKWYSDPVGDRLRSYAPFFVYQYKEEGNKQLLLFNEKLSSKYNTAHGDGWIGGNFSRKHMVLMPKDTKGGPNRKGQVLTIKEAQRRIKTGK